MRRWPFQSSEQAPLEHFPIIEDLLRRNIEDIFRVERQEARGGTFGWGGTLLVEPARALALTEPRFKSFGYTPFLGRQGDLVWIRAVPLAQVSERTKAGANLVLFALTVLSTLAAGSLVSGSFPFVTFNPSLEPFRLLDGVPFAFTLLAILGTHEFGHYFTARYHGASVSLPYFIPAPPPIFLFGTMGAVIRMRSPARDRNSLFDIAVAGGHGAAGPHRAHLRGLAADARAHLAGLRIDPARHGRVRPSGGPGRLGRALRDRAQPVPGGAARRRPHRLRVVRALAPAGLHRHLRRPHGPGRGVPLRELDRVRGPDPAPHGLPPPTAARRSEPALAPPLRPRRLLPHPPDPPGPARPHQLGHLGGDRGVSSPWRIASRDPGRVRLRR